MANNERKNSPVNDQKSLAENIGVSETMEDFGGGKGQLAGTQETAASQDQFDKNVEEIYDENDFRDKAEQNPPYDYFENEESEK